MTSQRRLVTANIAMSLDGRVNGPGGDYDMSWIIPHAVSDGARDHMIAITAPATTAVLGRKNYEGFHAVWPGVADLDAADPRDRRFSAWLNDVEKVVFSTTLAHTEWTNARVAELSPVHQVEALRRAPGGDIVVLASSSIIRALLVADLVDRLSITLCPVVAGGGASLFDADVPASNWRLTGDASTDTGALCLVYERA